MPTDFIGSPFDAYVDDVALELMTGNPEGVVVETDRRGGRPVTLHSVLSLDRDVTLGSVQSPFKILRGGWLRPPAGRVYTVFADDLPAFRFIDLSLGGTVRFRRVPRIKTAWYARIDGINSDTTPLNAAFAAAAEMATATGNRCVAVDLGNAVYRLGALLDAGTGLVIPARAAVETQGARLTYLGTGQAVQATFYESYLAGALHIDRGAGDQGVAIAAAALTANGVLFVNSSWSSIGEIECTGFRVPFDFLDSHNLKVGACLANNYYRAYTFRTLAAATTVIDFYGAGATTVAYAGGMAGTKNIYLFKNAPGDTIDGINFHGGMAEGPVERKLHIGAGVNLCRFDGVYWDAPSGGTDFEFEAGSTGNVVNGGANVSLMVVSDLGTNNEVNRPGDHVGDLTQQGNVTVTNTGKDVTIKAHADSGCDATLSAQADAVGGAEARVQLGDNVTAFLAGMGYNTDPASPTANVLRLIVNAIDAWYLLTTGSLIPAADATMDIGDATHQVHQLHLSDGVKVAGNYVLTARQPAIANPAGGATVDAEARTAIIAILDALRPAGHGAIAL